MSQVKDQSYFAKSTEIVGTMGKFSVWNVLGESNECVGTSNISTHRHIMSEVLDLKFDSEEKEKAPVISPGTTQVPKYLRIKQLWGMGVTRSMAWSMSAALDTMRNLVLVIRRLEEKRDGELGLMKRGMLETARMVCRPTVEELKIWRPWRHECTYLMCLLRACAFRNHLGRRKDCVAAYFTQTTYTTKKRAICDTRITQCEG